MGLMFFITSSPMFVQCHVQTVSKLLFDDALCKNLGLWILHIDDRYLFLNPTRSLFSRSVILMCCNLAKVCSWIALNFVQLRFLRILTQPNREFWEALNKDICSATDVRVIYIFHLQLIKYSQRTISGSPLLYSNFFKLLNCLYTTLCLQERLYVDNQGLIFCV